ncbi:MAG: acyltransferase [Bacteroidia bacterium]|jgi:peptidoglycan/LPS O-acetylase OafA/YrhL
MGSPKFSTSTKNYLPELDGLRFLAFLFVFIGHFHAFSDIPFLSILYKYGYIGVDLFFALSAYLFTKLLSTEYRSTGKINLKKFYIRRVLRIWPLYFTFILLSIGILFWAGAVFTPKLLKLIGTYLTFSYNIFLPFFGRHIPLPHAGHLWTVCYEEQFYLLIPFLIPLLIRMSTRQRIILFISSFVLLNCIRWWFIEKQMPFLFIYFLPVTHFEAILLGIVVGFMKRGTFKMAIYPIILAILSIYLFIALTFLPDIQTVSYLLFISYSLAGLFAAVLLYAILNSGYLKKIFSYQPLVFLGKRSYGLYVYHTFATSVISGYSDNLYLSFIIAMSFTIVLSVVSYKFLETPFLKWKEKFVIVKSRPI